MTQEERISKLESEVSILNIEIIRLYGEIIHNRSNVDTLKDYTLDLYSDKMKASVFNLSMAYSSLSSIQQDDIFRHLSDHSPSLATILREQAEGS